VNCSSLLRTIIATAFCAISILPVTAQGVANGNKPATPSPALPLSTQLKKTVVFLKADCLHDLGRDVAQLTPDALVQLPAQQVVVIKQQLTAAILLMQKLKQSMAKLTSEETAMLKPGVLSSLEIPQMGSLVSKMASLTTEEIGRLKPEEIMTLPIETHMGTGFIVLVPNESATPEGQRDGFGYLVTNRHVAQQGIENGKPCHVLNYSLLLNRKGDSTNNASRAEWIRLGNVLNWHFSADDSVDLAVLNYSASPDVYDYMSIPVSLFTTQTMVEQGLVVEGDPVLFSGLFIQSFLQVPSLEPIVRSGILAMVPNGVMETTLHKPGRVYLAETHSFGGNSGSPIFIDTNKFANIIAGPSFKLLGVISGEILESSDFTLHVTTSYAANLGTNSDVSVVVPAHEITSILDSPSLQAERNAFNAAHVR
jgi:hypothetical protein